MRPPILLATTLALAGCVMAFPSPVAPSALRISPAADATLWAKTTMPSHWIRLHFTWRYHNFNTDQNTSGTGSIVLTPPDSLFLSYRPTLLVSGGDAGVVGDSAIWAEPKADVEKLVPSYQLLWGMVGVARPPSKGWTVESGQDVKAQTTSIQYTRAGDTVTYVSVRGGQPRLETRVTVGGRPIGLIQTMYDQFRHLTSARLTVLGSPAELRITFDSTTKQDRIDKDAWTAPHDH